MIERGDMINVARDISLVNGFGDRISFYQEDIQDVELPELADVVVSETIGHMGVAEGFLSNMLQARARFLKPCGITVPSSISILVAPVQSPAAFKAVSFWNGSHFGIDFSPAARYATRQPYLRAFTLDELIAPACTLATLNIPTLGSATVEGTLHFNVIRPAQLHGLCVWFVAGLGANVFLDTAPQAQPTHWAQTYLPLPKPIDVVPEVCLRVTLKLPSDSPSEWQWICGVERQRAKPQPRFATNRRIGSILSSCGVAL